jgi:hypothetical protein
VNIEFIVTNPLDFWHVHEKMFKSHLLGFSRLCVCLSVFPLHCPTEIIYEFIFSHLCAACPTHLIFLYFTTLITFIEEYIWRISLICDFYYPPITCSILHPRIFHSTLLLNALNARNDVSRPYRTTGKYQSFICFNLNAFVYRTGRQNILDLMVAIIPGNNFPLISAYTLNKTPVTYLYPIFQNKLPHLVTTRNKWQHLNPFRNS